ncbi:MAG: CBS domain-containing protein [Clostridia bacterium]|nr:CBS domain-containing protein [Clostridia bacterium]
MTKSILRFMIPKSLVEYINIDSSVRQALEKMNFHRYTAIPVLDSEGKYIGTLRNDDIFNYFLKSGSFDKFTAEDIPISEILDVAYSKPVLHNTSIRELIESVKEHNFVPIVDDRGCFIGIVLRREILNYLLKHIKDFD